MSAKKPPTYEQEVEMYKRASNEMHTKIMKYIAQLSDKLDALGDEAKVLIKEKIRLKEENDKLWLIAHDLAGPAGLDQVWEDYFDEPFPDYYEDDKKA